MDLSQDEQRLIEEFRKLPPSSRDDLLAHAAALMHRAGDESRHESESPRNQCRLKGAETRPEAEKTPIFTE
jgi:hypothetical protein